ncbi:helix-turn-helix domain-containing protein [Breoghania sp.]|uniref:GlxA family transcriptional regulator n=1 Tax=Breoghania sp. TaxID=2065378 RepID=UPI002AA888CF|nr:helix-turn-helix domain-containing protein [Breoghania sp.]
MDDENHLIWVISLDEYRIVGLCGMIAVFSVANEILSSSANYEVRCIGLRHGRVCRKAPLQLVADAVWQDLRNEPVDTILITGPADVQMPTISDREQAAEVKSIAEAATRAHRVCSVGTGAFLLGEAGLLSGRRVAMHPEMIGPFRRRFGDVLIEPDAPYVADGKVWTSTGLVAGLDMALALIGCDLGREAAKRVRRHLMPHMHPQEVRKDCSSTHAEHGSGPQTIDSIISEMEESPSGIANVASLAARSGMNSRNFGRRFKAATGQSPSEFISLRRLSAAKTALETSDLAIKQIANEVGFSSVSAFGRAFVKQVGMSPNAYRKCSALQARTAG